MSTMQQPKEAEQTNGTTSNPPNQTLYVGNLHIKLKKDDLRRALYCLFSTYGPVLDIVALRTEKMIGQAHVVFRDVQTSSQAMRALQDTEFFGRPLVISYAKGKSNVISRLDGSNKVPDSAKAPTIAPSNMTETQKSVFQNPHAALPSKPPAVVDGETRGVKRPHDEAEEEASDAPMEEDSDDSAMEESDDE